MTLDEAIQQLVNLGEYDPLTIARKLEERQGRDWLVEQVAFLAEEIVQQRARKLLSNQRHSAEVALRPGDVITSAKVKLNKYWVPEYGWKPAGEVTPDDFDARGRWYQRLSVANAIMAAWCFEVASVLRDAGVGSLRQFRGTLPELPSVVGDVPELELTA